jgi:HTH-type transcriptional regulator/antitoxin HigA
MEIRPIKTESDYAAAMRRIEAVWGATPGTPEGDELEILVTLAEAYERQHYPIDLPDLSKPSSSGWSRRARTTGP